MAGNGRQALFERGACTLSNCIQAATHLVCMQPVTACLNTLPVGGLAFLIIKLATLDALV